MRVRLRLRLRVRVCVRWSMRVIVRVRDTCVLCAVVRVWARACAYAICVWALAQYPRVEFLSLSDARTPWCYLHID